MYIAKRLTAIRNSALLVSRFSTTKLRSSDHVFVHRDTPINNENVKFEFDKKNLPEVQKILAKYPENYKKGAIIPLLHLAQKQHGWTSLGVMNHVAGIVDVPPMRVYEVATFYTMFNREPVGKYFLQVCGTTPCQLCGSDNIFKTVEKHLGIKKGETTKDKLFTLVEVECAGACVNAPVMAINDDYYEDLTPELTVKVLDSFKSGKPLPPGPQGTRRTCEPAGGLTTLKSEPPGPGFMVRSDL
ncbi:putative NADH dehydrogenase [ubiquinone] flavoprotein 2, mitochondrial [Zancudomyces culisetae]|uniref:Putative NADH dehydrogenase [ubiquinone] flavoprotein 2, mitochondrial n=1 Tax=Zancudomyces culisetae TaxID=1213189 RepID=A0A1R1PGE0_ZANCU|nr:putative NADH dehydrogenase [ubiquinone] flavoprotein 2, mitochondrial [Zancudomyces culisetae]|eukprot:OMH79983.1 putative NADH dehydrogenase [ubiquinone] flavoprotein 2, mitochondrial [Zancudomyces culisetae]